MFQIGFFILIFLLGSIPFGLLISRYWLKIDIRMQGSGNIGMTNVMRVGGKWPGIVTFVLDFGKGSLAVLTAQILFPVSESEPETQLIFHSLAGITVVCGHVFSVFLSFKGGKGIATLFGMVVAIHYEPALYCAAIFILMLLFTRYVSLSSMSAVVLFPVLLIYVFREDAQLLIAFGITAAIMVILTHQKNIKRLIAGAENKANILPKHRRDRNH